jgi:hypothetical protein
MFVSSAVLVLNTLISANVDGHFELFLQSKEEITLVGGLVADGCCSCIASTYNRDQISEKDRQVKRARVAREYPELDESFGLSFTVLRPRPLSGLLR